MTGSTDDSSARVWAEDAQLGDEYISLTFHESESEDEDTDDEDEANGEEQPDEGGSSDGNAQDEVEF